jgi:hypothetical protein
MEMDEVMTLLNKKSGLFGISKKSLDTRVLMKDYGKDLRVTLAMDMFSYRLVKAVGAYLCALGGADAIVFGGGIGENTPLVRERVCASLRWCGLEMDVEKIGLSLRSRARSRPPVRLFRPLSFSAKKVCRSHTSAPRHREWRHLSLLPIRNPTVGSACRYRSSAGSRSC